MVHADFSKQHGIFPSITPYIKIQGARPAPAAAGHRAMQGCASLRCCAPLPLGSALPIPAAKQPTSSTSSTFFCIS